MYGRIIQPDNALTFLPKMKISHSPMLAKMAEMNFGKVIYLPVTAHNA